MSIRTERVAEEIKHRLNSAMTKDLMDLNTGLVTVSKVIMTADLKIAKIYLTFLGNKEPAEKLVDKINFRKKHIRYLLGKQLTLKYTPDIFFFYDDTVEYSDRINKLLNEIKKSEEAKHPDENQES
ncbi:MAG: 30S ribosome-binding factor RbfA [Ignavibacteria bacterium]|jgi:ribosome-binding factor A|nr:30S ribosome-binding factor RbfA [Ignavibacteria bacterium]